MKPPWALVWAAVLLPALAYAGGDAASSGAALHETHCTRCHGADIYTRQNRIVNSYVELRKRVQECELGAELGWFDEEVDAVATYLNEAFYRFQGPRE